MDAPRVNLAPMVEYDDEEGGPYTRATMCRGCGGTLCEDSRGVWENGTGHDQGCPVDLGLPEEPWRVWRCPELNDGTHFMDTTRAYPAWWDHPSAPECEECCEEMVCLGRVGDEVELDGDGEE